MQETFQQIIEAMGGTVTHKSGEEHNWGIARGGEIIHEVGATKMGTDPKTSVLNQYCCWLDVKQFVYYDVALFKVTPIRILRQHYGRWGVAECPSILPIK